VKYLIAIVLVFAFAGCAVATGLDHLHAGTNNDAGDDAETDGGVSQ
jgi:hypothetical protein